MQTQPVDSKPLPPVEQVRPGLWSIPVPLPIVLRYVFVYAFETDRGPLHRRRGVEHRRRVRRAERRAQRGRLRHRRRPGCHGHAHPPRPLRARGSHPRDLGRLDRAAPGRRRADPRPLRGARRPARAHGRVAPPARSAGRARSKTLRNASMPARQFVEFATPDVLLEDGERPDIPGWDAHRGVDARATRPATSASGSRATSSCSRATACSRASRPNVNLNPQTGDDPLGDYLRSLERLGTYDARRAPRPRVALREPPRSNARAARAPRAAIPRGDRGDPRRLPHRVGDHAAHGVVATVGRRRQVHSSLRYRRGDGTPAHAGSAAASCVRSSANRPAGSSSSD